MDMNIAEASTGRTAGLEGTAGVKTTLQTLSGTRSTRTYIPCSILPREKLGEN